MKIKKNENDNYFFATNKQELELIYASLRKTYIHFPYSINTCVEHDRLKNILKAFGKALDNCAHSSTERWWFKIPAGVKNRIEFFDKRLSDEELIHINGEKINKDIYKKSLENNSAKGKK